jgi:hypothetical protein
VTEFVIYPVLIRAILEFSRRKSAAAGWPASGTPAAEP